MLTEEQKTEIKREVFSRIAELLSSYRGSKSISDDEFVQRVRSELFPEPLDDPLLIDHLPANDPDGVGKIVALMLAMQARLTEHARRGLSPASSEARSLEPVVRVIARAVEVLGTSEKALRWMNAPVRSLGDRTPASLLDSPEGIANIEDALGRIEHGVW